MRFPLIIASLSASLILCAVASAESFTPVSGYEIFLGRNCTLGGKAGTCGTTFTGWTGIKPTGGFLPFPGTGRGFWSLQISYIGQPAFNGSVTVVGGSWSFFFLNGTGKHGTVLSGSVAWPVDANSTISGCKPGEAIAQANISVAGGSPKQVVGCLHDLPAGQIIPPTVWGAFLF